VVNCIDLNMRGLCRFIFLGFILQGVFQLMLAKPFSENDELSDTVDKLEEFEESRRKDREKLLQKSASSLDGDVPKAGELFEGDIVMDESLRKAVLGEEADKRSEITNKDRLWKDNTVYYAMDPKIWPLSKKCIKLAIKTFHRHTCIRFKKRKKEKDYIYISSYKGSCSSYVGKKGGRQPVSIGRGCTRLGTCQHELLHALGTIHEQSRPDRDRYLSILWNNIIAADKSNFRKYSYGSVDNEGVPFDYMSVMLYPNHAFAKDRSRPTLIAKSDRRLKFGQRDMFSAGDVKAINKLYNCPKDRYDYSLPQILSDEEVKERKDMRDLYSEDY